MLGACLLAMGGPAFGVASEWVVRGPSRLRLVTPYTVAAAGEVRLGLEVRLERGWHSYWKNSGDAGYPPTVEVTGVSGLELLYPAPHRFELPGELVAFGYEDEVVYPLRGRLAGGRSPVRLTAEVDYVVCAAECIPFQASLAVDQPVGSRAVEDAETAPLVARWWSRVPRAVEAVRGVETDGVLVAGADGRPALEVRVRGAGAGEPEVFFEPHELFETERPEVRATAAGVVFHVPLAPREAGKPLPASIPFAWTVTGLERDGRALALEAQRAVPGEIRPAADPAAAGGASGAAAAAAALAGAGAVGSILLALYLWGILGPAPAAGATPRSIAAWRGLLGFAAAAGTVWALLALAGVVRREALASVELTLLALALCAWLRHRAGGRGMLPAAWTVGLLACAAAAVWLAHRGQL